MEASSNDAQTFSHDPTFRLIGSEKVWDRGAALPRWVHATDKAVQRLSCIRSDIMSLEHFFS
jgi:hypothetical protein